MFSRPGPLLPEFVKRTMLHALSADNNGKVRRQNFVQGRALSWDIPDEILITGKHRETNVVTDPVTLRMTADTRFTDSESIHYVPDIDCAFKYLMMG